METEHPVTVSEVDARAGHMTGPSELTLVISPTYFAAAKF